MHCINAEVFMRRCCVALMFLLLLLASGCSPHLNLNAPFHSRQPNPHERFYTAVAANFGDSKMCEKISKRALDQESPGLDSTEWKVILQKSECYFYVAMSTKNTKLCAPKEAVLLGQTIAGLFLVRGLHARDGIPQGGCIYGDTCCGR
jgi:hypothetical protein